LKHFPISGNINFESLAKRLKKLKISVNDALLLKIGHVENKNTL